MSLQYHAERIANEQDFDAGLTRNACETGVVCCKTGKLLATLFYFIECGQSDVSNLALAANGVEGSA